MAMERSEVPPRSGPDASESTPLTRNSARGESFTIVLTGDVEGDQQRAYIASSSWILRLFIVIIFAILMVAIFIGIMLWGIKTAENLADAAAARAAAAAPSPAPTLSAYE